LKTNLHKIGRFEDRISFLYVDRAVINQADRSLTIHEFDGVSEVPIAALALLMLGPGVSISHEAVKALAENNCVIVWSGELGVRCYAAGQGGSRHSRNLLLQARNALDQRSRMQVVVRMYEHRFGEGTLDLGLTLRQIRGKEGARVRDAYANAARECGIKWGGREYDRKAWDGSDPVNRALSAANACLYGLVHAAIISGGYSPAIGFIHTGKQLSFVYDIADLYKAELTIPIAFKTVRGSPVDLEPQVRAECRRRFHGSRLMKRILPDIRGLLAAGAESDEDEYAEDPSKPAELWDPEGFTADTPIGQILAAGR